MQGQKLRRRYTLASTVAAAAIAGTVLALAAIPSPVQAEGTGCETLAGHTQVAGSYIHATRVRFCDESEIPLPVSIQRYLSPGVWETVASGTGEVTYYCNGTAYNVYKTTGTVDEFAILCG